MTAHVLSCPRGYDFEAIGDSGRVTASDNGGDWELRVLDAGNTSRWKAHVAKPFPPYQAASTTLRLIEDLVSALDTGGPTRGGVEVARRTLELSFAIIDSHRRGGARVTMPLEHRTLRLQRDHQANQPKLHA